MFRILWNTLKDWLCYLQNESASLKVFLLSGQVRGMDFIRSGKAYMSFNLFGILNFFLRKLLASLNLKQ